MVQPTALDRSRGAGPEPLLDRVVEIGVEKPFVTPVIARNDQGSDWFEGNVSVGVRVEDPAGGSPTYVPLTFNDVPTLQQAVKAAEQAGQPGQSALRDGGANR